MKRYNPLICGNFTPFSLIFSYDFFFYIQTVCYSHKHEFTTISVRLFKYKIVNLQQQKIDKQIKKKNQINIDETCKMCDLVNMMNEVPQFSAH